MVRKADDRGHDWSKIASRIVKHRQENKDKFKGQIN